MTCSEVHKGRQRCLTQFRGPAKGDSFFAVKFQSKQSGGFLGEVGLFKIGCFQQR